jgi:RAB protein geranylgeranyltransferase component A
MCSFRTSLSRRLDFINIGKKVLHIDRNPFYGGEGASLNLTNLWKVFRPGKNPPNELGQNRDWNIDLIPKYIMSGGKLVKILLKTRVSRYLEWKSKLILTKVLMELMFFKLNKRDFSVKEELKFKRFLQQTHKP